MNVEERVEEQAVTIDQDDSQPERHASEAQRAAVVEAAYILEALRK
jgi:hypothetical protein